MDPSSKAKRSHKGALAASADACRCICRDVSQPLPDVPALEKFRPLDPTTAGYDAAGKRGSPADYWATLDLKWWEEEGYPAHLKKIREFPWSTLEDRMEKSVPNLAQGAMV